MKLFENAGSIDPPRYPRLKVSVRSHNPLALVAATRHELRRAGAGKDDIDGFTAQALRGSVDAGHVLAVARRWVGAVDTA